MQNLNLLDCNEEKWIAIMNVLNLGLCNEKTSPEKFNSLLDLNGNGFVEMF